MIRPNAMRNVDYWIGIPFCFLLTWIYRLQRLVGLHNPRHEATPTNVLFIELAEMGSTVLAYPAVMRLRELYPGARTHFVLFQHIQESIEAIDLVPRENILTIDATSLFSVVADTIRFAIACRRRKIDTAVNLEMFARYSTILTYLSGARKRVAFHKYSQEGLYVGDFLTHKVLYNPHIHVASSFLALVESLNLPPGEIPLSKFPVGKAKTVGTRVVSDDQRKKRMFEILRQINPEIGGDKKIVVVNPNASELISVRRWPLLYYAELVRRLVEDPDVFVVLTGVASEKPDARFIQDAVTSDRVLDLTGATTLRDLMDLYNIGSVLVTNDSGPAHFVALTNVYIVVFFGPETPKLYAPLSNNCTVMYSDYACSPCVSAFNQRRSPCNNNLCLKRIEVEEVHQAVRDVLYGERGAPCRPGEDMCALY